MRVTPNHVKTFTDLGEYAFGSFGKYAVLITQFGTCLVVPIAFLVLGGATIMPVVFEGGNANVYILIIGLALWSIVLIRSLKEATWVALLGSAGTLLGDLFAVLDSMLNSPYYDNITPVFEANNVLKVFGSMSMAFGGAVIIPAIQRQSFLLSLDWLLSPIC